MINPIVYVVGPPDITIGTPCKIGYSTNLEKRMRSLRTSSSVDLRVHREIPGTRKTEEWLHSAFLEQKISREWFSFVPEMLSIEPPEMFAQLAAAAPPKPGRAALIHDGWEKDFIKVLQSSLNADGHGANRISAATGCDKRAANNYLYGIHLPGMKVLLQMMAAYPAVAEFVVRSTKYSHSERVTRAMAALEIAKEELSQI